MSVWLRFAWTQLTPIVRISVRGRVCSVSVFVTWAVLDSASLRSVMLGSSCGRNAGGVVITVSYASLSSAPTAPITTLMCARIFPSRVLTCASLASKRLVLLCSVPTASILL